MKKKIAILIFVGMSSSILGIFPAYAKVETPSGGGMTQVRPNPSPGPSPTAPGIRSKSEFEIPASIGAVVQVIEIGLINRGTGTPGILDGPRSVISNIGGYGQIIPTIGVVARSSLPIVLGIMRGMTLFGAANG